MSRRTNALSALFGLEAFGMRLGLDNMAAYCEAAGHPERAWPAFHVAGTNGKGTTAHCIDALARANGLRTGLYTSPHLVDFRERIRVDGSPIPESSLVDAWRRVGPFAEGRSMTFFEAGTLIAFEWFAECAVDLGVIEVGLGGRLDATNLVRPEITVVTTISLDHERQLGDELPAIAREKAGIFKPGVPALVGDGQSPAVREALAAVARECGAPLAWLDDEARWRVRSMRPGSTVFDYESDLGRLERLELPLAGEHFVSDAALALRSWEVARGAVTESSARAALAQGAPPGRMEWRATPGAKVLLDVAHNPAAIERMIETLERTGPPRWTFVAGILSDKKWRDMLDALLGFASRGWLCDLSTANPDRRLPRAEVEAAIEVRPRLDRAESVGAGLDAATAVVEAGAADAILVTGSFHTVGEALVELGLAVGGHPYEQPPRRVPALAGVSPWSPA